MVRPGGSGLPLLSLDPRLMRAAVVAGAGCLVLADAGLGSAATITAAIAAVTGVAALITLSRHPVFSLATLFVFAPLQQPLLAYAYAHGAPAGLLRTVGAYQELVVAALALTVVRQAGRLRLPRPADLLIVAFVSLATVYLVVGDLAPGVLGDEPPAALISAYRLNVLFFVTFAICRQISWSPGDLRRLGGVILFPAAVMVVGGAWEFLDDQGFTTFVVHTLDFTAYSRDVLGQTGAADFSALHTALGTGSVLRLGGWFFDPLNLAFYLVVPLALALQRQLRRGNRIADVALTALIAVTLILTQTRSSVLAGAVVVVLLLARSVGVQLRGRARLVPLAFIAVLVLAPVVSSSHIVQRVQGAFNGQDESTQGHTTSTSAAVRDLIANPAGRGLGTNPVTSVADQSTHGVTAENAYLQVGDEIGLIAMVLFIGIVARTQGELRRVGRDTADLDTAAAVWAAGWGLAVNGLFLHVWLSFPVSLTFWSLAGVATSGRAHSPAEPEVVSQVTRDALP